MENKNKPEQKLADPEKKTHTVTEKPINSNVLKKYFNILLSISIVLILLCVVAFSYIYCLLPEHRSYNVRREALVKELYDIQRQAGEMENVYVGNCINLRKTDLLHVIDALKQNHAKDSVLNVACCKRLDFLEQEMRAECDRMHNDYSSYLIQLQTWTTVLVGVITIIIIIIGYIFKTDLNETVRDYENRYEGYHKVSTDSLDRLKRKKNLLEKVNRYSLLLSALRALSNGSMCWPQGDIKVLSKDLLEGLNKLNEAFSICLKEEVDYEEWRLELKCILINYLALVNELEVIINSNFETVNIFEKLRVKVKELLEGLDDWERNKVIVQLAEIQKLIDLMKLIDQED